MAQINKPNTYFNIVTYTGNGSTQSITGVNFQPDWVWFKNRTSAYSHKVYDVVRGVTKELDPDNTNAENTTTDEITSFDSDGFSVAGGSAVNQNTADIVAWNWLGGGTGVSNTDGSITSTVSANTTSGFSVVSFTGTQTLGATVGHGLGAVPKVIIIKDRDNARNWNVYHASVCDSDFKFLRINTTDGVITGGATHFDISAMSSTVFGLGADNESNPIASAIAYCFAEKKGFSKFGSYTGNGSADGTFVYTGFKPAFVMIKRTSGGTDSWYIYDTARAETNGNEVDIVLEADVANIEFDTSGDLDFLSNGFKNRGTISVTNGSGENYIYMAFAENPLVGTNNIPTTAR